MGTTRGTEDTGEFERYTLPEYVEQALARSHCAQNAGER
jgi:hypothetical protein